MPVSTHCLPNGALAAHELPVPNISYGSVWSSIPTGLKRGVVVFMHGMAMRELPVIPPVVADVGGIFPSYIGSFAFSLVTDGWVVIQPCYPEDLQPGYPVQAIYDDVANDTGKGARHLATTLRWWDHILEYVHRRWGNWPVVPFGFSWGGWHAMQVAKQRQADILAYGAHIPVVTLSALSSAWSSPVDFTATDTSGLDIGAHGLDAVTKPGMIGWHTSDSAVGYTLAQAVYTNALAAGAPVSSRSEATEHLVSTGDVTAFMSWFTGTVDPLAPKTLS